jgi:hypothetical protein
LVSASETIFVEDFEDADIFYTTSQPDNLTNLDNFDYYGRINVASLPDNLNYNNRSRAWILRGPRHQLQRFQY